MTKAASMTKTSNTTKTSLWFVVDSHPIDLGSGGEYVYYITTDKTIANNQYRKAKKFAPAGGAKFKFSVPNSDPFYVVSNTYPDDDFKPDVSFYKTLEEAKQDPRSVEGITVYKKLESTALNRFDGNKLLAGEYNMEFTQD